MYSHYVHIALILRQYLSIRCRYSESPFEPGRGEAKGADYEIIYEALIA